MKKGTHSYIEDLRNENILIFIRGEILPRNEAKISVFDSGFLLGDGIWEGIRLYNGHLCFIDDHLKRLFNGARQLKINIGKSQSKIKYLIEKTIEANKMFTDVHIRIIISRGLKKTPYQHPNANIGGPSIVIIPEYKIANSNMLDKGIRLCLVETIRGTQNSQNPQLNTLSKLNCIFGCLEADEKGFDEGIMLDINGYVSTCNSTNLFVVKNKRVITSTGEFCLPGITRKNIINICKSNNIPIIEKQFMIDEVHNADEVFVTGTFAGVIPAIQIDKFAINNLKCGPITKQLSSLYKQYLNKIL